LFTQMLSKFSLKEVKSCLFVLIEMFIWNDLSHFKIVFSFLKWQGSKDKVDAFVTTYHLCWMKIKIRLTYQVRMPPDRVSRRNFRNWDERVVQLGVPLLADVERLARTAAYRKILKAREFIMVFKYKSFT